MTFRFPRFIAALNVFATIRTLRDELAESRFREANLTDQLYFVRVSRDAANQRSRYLGEALIHADQAIDAFMDEREELKGDIVDLSDAQAEIVNYGIASTAAIVQLRNEAQEQAADTLEVVEYVKAVEARLAAAGITIEDGESGPIVVVNQVAFVAAVRGAGHVEGPDVRLAA